MVVVELTLLLIVANGGPVLMHKLCGDRWSSPVDGGRRFRDGRRWLGDSKTWRGVVSGMLTCTAAGSAMGFGLGFSASFGALSLIGDLFSSFCKRRLNLPSSARAIGLDHVPESLLPTLAGAPWLHYPLSEALMASALFVALAILVSPLLFRLGIRRQPH